MPLLRLLPACIVATVCALPAAAQSTATSPTPNIQVPPLSTESTPFFLQAQPSTSPLVLTPPAKSHIQISSATPAGPCYTMRSYNYTARDLESNSPKPSSYITCTPSVAGSFKSAAVPVVK